MPKKSSKTGVNVAIVVALIGLAGTIITALLSSPVLLKLMEGTPTETAAPPPSRTDATLVFSEDFEDGTASGFGLTGNNWTIGKDKSNKVLAVDATTLPPEYWSSATFGPTDFRDGIIEFKVKYETVGGIYVVFRIHNAAEYNFYLTPDQALLGYKSEAQGWQYTPLSDSTIKPFSAQTGNWYIVRIEIRGTQITAYLDGNKLFTGADSRLESGSLQFRVDSGVKALVDDVKVWSLDQ